jgi:N utilization substance protein B
MTSRRKARELALQTLYAYRIHERDPDEIVDELAAGQNLAPDHLDFAHRIVKEVLTNLTCLDDEIARLAENWELERIATIDRIILRIALAEIIFMPDIPCKVAINEAIDMAKKYSTMESSSFVNGVLDAAISRKDSF